ncbi:MAG: bifunctional DNA-formamidopyrimidine glycosylase/DNA-(apurinic or apyrimidinic site) lyase [Sutterellaceae bacterium]|nr:bifunctional DNA-formamidopyrimidine glycosylase/DNA-(apurinic or apyrimidinic site) lyase [Sutterellaceae bacterium]
MPELPEVEVTRLGLSPALVGQHVLAVVCRTPKLREPLDGLADGVEGLTLVDIRRRGKYLIWVFADDSGTVKEYFLSHLGRSGFWRLWDNPAPAPGKHDHVDIVFEKTTARLTDPRRFGSIRRMQIDPESVQPLSELGAEPFDETLTPEVFAAAMRKHKQSVKEVLMAGKVVVGCGNIYCSESLFQAKIDPRRAANRVSADRYGVLLGKIRSVLASAIVAGGSTLRDFHGVDGSDGYFALTTAVYGREGEACRVCGTTIKRIVQGQRATFYCPRCQK